MTQPILARMEDCGNILKGVADLVWEDPTVVCLAATAVGLGIYRRSLPLAFATFYGGFAAARMVNSIANAIGNGLTAHADIQQGYRRVT